MRSSRAGLVVAGAALVIVSIILQWAELFGIGVGLAAIPFIVGQIANPGVVRWWDTAVPLRVPRGDEASIRIGVEIQTANAPLISAVAPTGERVWLDEESSEIVWPIGSNTRGRIEAGPSTLEIGDPLGLTSLVVAERTLTPVIIVPRVVPVNVTLALRVGSATGAQGMRTIESPQAGSRGIEEFHSLREYAMGDSLCLIHWRATARTGRVVVRNLTDSDNPRLLVVLDAHQSSYHRPSDLFPAFDSATFETAIDLAASWAWWGCEIANNLVVTSTATGSPTVTVNPRTRKAALDALAGVESQETLNEPVMNTVHTLADQFAASTVVFRTGPSGPDITTRVAGRTQRAALHRVVSA
jgi:uncharacterized protein (DUF58 family)